MTTIAEQANEVKAAAASRLPAEVVAVFASDQAALAAGGIPAGAVSVGDQLAAVHAARRDRPDPDTRRAHRRRARRDRLLPRRLVPVLQPHPAHVRARPTTPAQRILGSPRRDLARDPGRVAQHPGKGRADLHGAQRHRRALAARARDHIRPLRGRTRSATTLGVDIRTTRADGGTLLPMPTVLIVDRDHIVRFVDIHPDYTGRTEVSDILAALQTLPIS